MRKMLNTLVLSAFTLGSLGAVEPYDSIHQLAYVPYFLPNSWSVYSEFLSKEGKIFVDVNSESNSASRYIAQNIQDESAKIYAISSWEGLGQFQQFLSNVLQESTTDRIVPIRMSSEEASTGLNVSADVIYLNSSDPATLYEDILRWVPHLAQSGEIMGDNWNFNQVELAVINAASDLGLNLKIFGTLWVLEGN